MTALQDDSLEKARCSTGRSMNTVAICYKADCYDPITIGLNDTKKMFGPRDWIPQM